MNQLFVALYIVGGLLAVGMIIGDIVSVAKDDVVEAIDVFNKLKTIGFHILQASLFIAIAFALSWISVGYIYIRNKPN